MIVLFDTPYFTSSVPTATAVVPGRYDVGVAGVGYMLDLRPEMEFAHRTYPLVRQQADAGTRPDEGSLNPDDLWRRAVTSWHGGAGQTFADRDISSPYMFRTSKGIDPWTEGQIGLLPDTDQKRTSTETNLGLAVAGSYCYCLDGDTLVRTTDVTVDSPTWSSVTAAGTAMSAPTAMASSGYTVWAVDGTATYYTTTAGSTYAAYHASAHAASLVRFVKSRLLTAGVGSYAATVYESTGTAGSAVATAVYTHPDTNWTWTEMCDGPAAIYLSGYSGDKSTIYRTAVKATGTSLDAPIVAGELPYGEVVYCMISYLGFLIIGTSAGVRFATLDPSGNIATIGDLLAAPAVRTLFAYGRFVWFGWSNLDGTSTGLGRLDLRTLNGTAPAYASDLMATAQGTVISAVRFGSRAVFAVSGAGVWAEDTVKVPSGTVDSGRFGWGLPDDKTLLRVTVRHAATAGTYTFALAVDDGAFTAAGPTVTTTAGTAGGTVIPVENRGELFELRFTLTRDATTTTSGPTITRWTGRADPSAARRMQIQVPLLLHRSVMTRTGQPARYDPQTELANLRALMESRQIVTYQEGAMSTAVIVDGLEWWPYREPDRPAAGWDGTCVLTLKTV